ncbi:BamA/TamA family outer membrane protein [Maribacter sp. 1_MG-2023]|uniref:translocation and assembly module lipoprotein TamL n=1 Tax=Maribacter sp. 1_MG-2023 TaxID=3062677 RepID=UPI0026E2AB03|nr:BamA/TamA family outer membrane protein [Maribacter sp. 1_MG-2023]MDO6473547.1 BamA/TamA family outer membrane protein [Maribacter sp. 1_MG-2023]
MAKLSLLSLLAIVLLSCNSLKKVEDDEYLVIKNSIYADSIKLKNAELESLIYQKPNSTVLGYPLRLNLYNLAKENPDSSYNAWLDRKENRKKRLNNLLSEKQVKRLGESFLVKGLSNWLEDIGEEPTVLDTSKTRLSLTKLSAYYESKGYFTNSTTYSIDSTKRKKAKVYYHIELGDPYMIDSLSNSISSKAIDSLYFLHSANSLIKEGQQFDLSNFNNERERLASIFRNSGIRNFQESSIAFDILRDTTRAAGDQKMNITLNIGDLKTRGENEVTTSAYKVEKINKINIYTDYLSTSTQDSLYTLDYQDYTIHYSKNFDIKPKTLANAIFFKKDSTYRDVDKIRTSRQLNALNVFKYPNIIFEADSLDNQVNTNIYLAPKTKYALSTNFEVSRSNIRRLGVGLGTTLLIRNIFKGAENLSISANGSYGLLSRNTFEANYFSEFGGDITLDFPRIWFPFINTSRIIPNYTLPKTRIAIGTNFQNNIGLDKQTLNTVLAYNWAPSDFVNHNVELLNIQFVRNVNEERFYNVYTNTYELLDEIADKYKDPVLYPELVEYFEPGDGDDELNLIIPSGTTGFTDAILNEDVASTPDDFDDVNSIEERRIRLTENNLIFATNYTFNKTNRTGILDNSFYQFRWKIEGAGNVLSAFSSIIPFNKKDDQLLVFGVPFSQYIKNEFEYVKYWDLSRSNVLAARAFFGIAIPYGNSNSIPFVRSYFGGGSNDNRAWFPYSLGPGSVSAINDFNEANLKLALNLEYRFPVAGDINGAIFADAGNIWNVLDNVEDPDATFDGLSSLKDIALGTGFGVRYDFTYFLFRLDLGFKTYNPAEIQSKRWFRDYNFANSVLQIGINYPF